MIFRFLSQLFRKGTPPVPVPMLPVPDPTAAPTHEILIMIDMTPFNYAMYIIWDAGLLDLIVTSDMIPSNFPQILNTSNFDDIAPGMFKKYPNMEMQLEVNVTKAPSFQVITPVKGSTHTALAINMPTDIIFQVLDPNTGLENAFDVHCPFEASVAIDVTTNTASKQQSINGSLTSLDCTLSLVNTNVGNVSVTQLQGLVSLVTALVEPIVNKKLANMSIPIPSLGSVNLTNSEIAFIEEGQYLLVASDVVLKTIDGPKEKGEMMKVHQSSTNVNTKDLGLAVNSLKNMSSRGKFTAWLLKLMGIFHF
jgi:hypothetical protein